MSSEFQRKAVTVATFSHVSRHFKSHNKGKCKERFRSRQSPCIKQTQTCGLRWLSHRHTLARRKGAAVSVYEEKWNPPTQGFRARVTLSLCHPRAHEIDHQIHFLQSAAELSASAPTRATLTQDIIRLETVHCRSPGTHLDTPLDPGGGSQCRGRLRSSPTPRDAD